MLPEMNGLEVCKTLKENYKTREIPIIMVTAKAEEADIVLGLELGADDYVTKPFSPRQLTARIKAALRRRRPAAPAQDRVIKSGEIELDTARHAVTVEGKPVTLTSKEFTLLQFLMDSADRVVSRESILDHVWGHDTSLDLEPRVVDKHIGELRKKIKGESARIVTIKNFGYRFES
jgi:two-component system alkaline phosphatase synthesis response regulator PhoP